MTAINPIVPINPMLDQAFRNDLIYTIDPVNSDLAKRIVSSIWSIYTKFVEDAIYVSSDQLDIFVDHANGRDVFQYVDHFIGALISSMLVNRSCTLLNGSPGGGKTATVQAIARMMEGVSIEDEENIFRCDREMSKESWQGNPDPSELMAGKENAKLKMDWLDWILKSFTVLIIDEVNRGPPDFQAQLLPLLSSGKIQYTAKFRISKPNMRVYLTMNNLDVINGTSVLSPLNYAFLDRITQSLKIPQANKYGLAGFKSRLSERRMGYNLDEVIPQMMTTDDLHAAAILASKMIVDDDADRLASYIQREADLCMHAPMFSKSLLEGLEPGAVLCKNCHFKGGVCQDIIGGSLRIYVDLIALSKAYAFWLQLPRVTSSLVHAIAIDVVAHRLIIRSEVVNEKSRGDIRAFITERYIEYCWSKLEHRRIVEESAQRLLNGDGTLTDVEKIISMSQNDLYVRLDMLPTVTKPKSKKHLFGNFNEPPGYEYIYSCAEATYIKRIKKVREAQTKRDIDALDAVLDEIPEESTPMDHLIFDHIYDAKKIIEINLKAQQWNSKTKKR